MNSIAERFDALGICLPGRSRPLVVLAPLCFLASCTVLFDSAGGGELEMNPLSPTDDTYVNFGTPDDTKGELEFLRINAPPDNTKYALLQFDLSNVPPVVEEATLELFVTVGGGSGTVFQTGDGWDEETLLPAATPEFTEVIENVTFGAGPVSIDVGAYVASERSGDGIVSFLIRSNTESGDMDMASKEAADPDTHPRLDVLSR